MITKIFGGKKIIIRELSKTDLRNVKEFQDFINSLVEENAQILLNKKITFKDEKNWLNNLYKFTKSKRTVFLFAEHMGKIVGTTDIGLDVRRMSHVGRFGIIIKKGYRGIGLGTYLGEEIIKLAKKKLKPKIISLGVFPNNKPAISLYKKLGFKKVARIPKQIQYKGKLINEFIMLKYL